MFAAQIIADLERIAKALDLREGNLGEKLLDIAASAVKDSMDYETGPGGFPWPSLSPAYETWKSAHFPGQPMAVLYGLMKTDDQIRGEREVNANSASMTYGTDAQARAEAEWFQDPTNPNQPPRPFYELTPGAVRDCDELLDEWFDKLMR